MVKGDLVFYKPWNVFVKFECFDPEMEEDWIMFRRLGDDNDKSLFSRDKDDFDLKRTLKG